jgi:uncharacterized surface anchored protein
MNKKITSILLALVIVFLSITSAYATPPANPDIESGTAAAGGNYFQYLSSEGWKDLKTPPHWVEQTGEIAYCLDHKADSPHGDEGYTAFNPQAVYSTRTYNGLLAILKNGYPYQKGGLSSTQSRYATANAVRAWLSESAGIGYNFMNLSRGYVRPKSGQEATYNLMVSLVDKARNNQQPTFSISTNPSNVTLSVQGNQLVGQTKIVFGNLNGYYTIDNSKLPSGVTISGSTGSNGDVLTITAPISYAGQTVNISKLFEGHDTRATSNIYWFEPSGNEQPVLVPVIDTTKPVVLGSLSFTSNGFGHIEVIKKDSETNANLSGAVFGIYNSSNQEVERLTTDINGHAVSGNLILGTYSVKEITAPQGYIINTNVFGNISVTPNNTTTVSIDNQPQVGKIRIEKINSNPDMGDYSLQGAIFEVYNDSGSLVGTVITNSTGLAITSNLPLGNYTIREKTAPAGYVINTAEYNAKLAYSGQTVSIVYDDVTIPNRPQTGTIEIVKQDSETGDISQGDAALDGAVFEIYSTSGALVERLKCLSNSITSKELPLGKYTIKEIAPPTGYLLNQNEYLVNIEYSNQTVNVNRLTQSVPDDVIKGRISIAKYADVPLHEWSTDNPKPPLSDVKFEIRLKSSGVLYDTITTDKDGLAQSRLLPYGTYTVTEIVTPEGYRGCNPFDVVVNENGKVYSFIIENEVYKSQVKVVKTDSTTGTIIPIAGVQFKIKDCNGDFVSQTQLYPTPVTIDVFETAEDGTLVLPEPLIYGEYTLHEISAPSGYILSEEALSFTISDDGATMVILEFENAPSMGQITIEKTGDMFTGADKANSDYGKIFTPTYSSGHLQGAIFEICAGEDISTPDGTLRYSSGEVVDTVTTNSDGLASSNELFLGTYIIKEIQAPDGYFLDTGEYIAYLEYENQSVAVVTEQIGIHNERQTAKITLVKEREVINWDTLEYSFVLAGEGFTFGLFANEDLVNQSGDVIIAKNSLISTSKTNQDSEVSFNIELPYASYYVQELDAPRIYIVDSTKYEFEVSYTSMNEDVIIIAVNDGEAIQNNLIKKTLQVIKVDSRNNKIYLQGAVFKLHNSKGDLLQTLITDKYGKAVSIALPMGEYTFTEIKAPTGYVLEDLELSVTISDDEKQVYSLTGDNRPTEVTITKTDISDDTPLPHAHIKIFNVNDDLVFEGITDENGKLVIHELPVGSYIFRETVAPIGYTLNTTTFDFEILEDGTIVGATNIQNTPTEVTLSKTDITTGLPLPNAEIEILNIDGESVFKGKTDENGEITITHLSVGSYTFIETKAPDGYILSIDELAFSIDEFGTITGETQMTNSPTVLNIFKVKYEDNSPLTGAGFKVKNWFGLNTLSFTVNDDGIYRYDADGEIKEILVDENGKAIVYGLPFGNYWLEESIVPVGYYPAAPAKITIVETNDINVPFETVIPNSVFVKLGLDRDRYYIPIAFSLVFLTLAGLVFFFVRRKRRKGKL